MGVVALLSSTLVFLLIVAPVDSRSIDKMILDSSQDAMFDVFHFMGDQLMTMVELDILMDMKEFERYKSGGLARSKRRASNNETHLWPDCIVSYEIDRGAFSSGDIKTIEDAMKEWENYTCLVFREKREGDRVFFTAGDGCYSRLGRVGDRQPIALAPGCRTKGVVVHEIGHAIGWYHEHARPDRNSYIQVNYDQIPERWRRQFDPAPSALVNNHVVKYDYLSVMHYSGDGFGDRTIQTLDPRFQKEIGQRHGMSFHDIKLANIMYKCGDMCTDRAAKRSCPSHGFLDKQCRCWCPPEQDVYPLRAPLRLCSAAPSVTTRRPAVTTPTTIAPPPQPSCQDVRSNCTEYRQRGDCILNAARMSALCAKTCGLCGPESKCMDMQDACPLMAKAGYCARDDGLGEYMRKECPASCELCSVPDPCQQSFADAPRSEASRLQTVGSVSSLVAIAALVYCTL